MWLYTNKNITVNIISHYSQKSPFIQSKMGFTHKMRCIELHATPMQCKIYPWTQVYCVHSIYSIYIYISIFQYSQNTAHFCTSQWHKVLSYHTLLHSPLLSLQGKLALQQPLKNQKTCFKQLRGWEEAAKDDAYYCTLIKNSFCFSDYVTETGHIPLETNI